MPIRVIESKDAAEHLFNEFKRLDAEVLEKYRERFSNDDLEKDAELKEEIDHINKLKKSIFKTSRIAGVTEDDWYKLEMEYLKQP